jgi:protein phosphatase
MRSEAGPHRSSNQDSAVATSRFVVVADGVGGHAGGDVASRTVTRRLAEALGSADVSALDAAALRSLVADANAALRRRAGDDPLLARMATTLTALVCGDGLVRVVHVGDSRAYLVHAGTGELVTHDDSLVQHLVDAGAIAEAEAASHPQRHVILRSLAGDDDDAAGLTVLEVPVTLGDRWVVCSDGLSDAVVQGEVLSLAAAATTPEEAAEALLTAALAADARDNITLVVADVVGTAPDDGGPPRWLGAAEREA